MARHVSQGSERTPKSNKDSRLNSAVLGPSPKSSNYQNRDRMAMTKSEETVSAWQRFGAKFQYKWSLYKRLDEPMAVDTILNISSHFNLTNQRGKIARCKA